MQKDRLSFGKVAVFLLPMAGSPMRAYASGQAASPPGGEQMSAPAENQPRLANPGQLSSLFKINDRDPESTVPTPKQRDGNPLEYGYFIQDLLAKAEAAIKRQDHQAAIRYYRALALAVPDRAVAWSRLCKAYEIVNDRQRAIGACRYAIDREGAELKDFSRFVRVVVAKQGDLSSEERTALNEVLTHLDKQPDMAIPAAHLRCQAAVKTQDQAAMGACTGVLAKAAPDDPKTIVFQWSYAVMRGQQAEAARLIDRAEKSGVSFESLEQMSKVTKASRRWPSRLMGVAAVAGVAGLLGVLFFLLRRRLGTRGA
jgi:tetratricopeptide (TPR) repeat protein